MGNMDFASKNSVKYPSRERYIMQVMTEQQLIAAIDWKVLLPLALELITEFVKPEKDWKHIFELGLQIIQMLFAVEESTGMAINWQALLALILQLIGMIGNTNK